MSTGPAGKGTQLHNNRLQSQSLLATSLQLWGGWGGGVCVCVCLWGEGDGECVYIILMCVIMFIFQQISVGYILFNNGFGV